ncbi:zinc ribbon domain-containing protein [Bacillus sp. JJ1566]|uniref:zinc ribbon domain-containing protein n=1 Tax=Bacillus sp. JJ1566 TaxID=3122961 RepID=UPI003000A99B
MVEVHNKEKKVQIFFLLLIVISYFLPWTKFIPNERSIDVLEINSSNLFEQTFFSINLMIKMGNLSFGDFIIIFIIACGILPPILGGITLYRMIKNKTFKGLKNATIIFSFLIIIIQFISNLSSNNIEVGEISLKLGYFLAVFSTIGLALSSKLSGNFNSIISFFNSKTNNILRSSNSTKKTSMNFCSSCGQEIVGNAQYCMNCGQNLKDNLVASNGNDTLNTSTINVQNLSSKLKKPDINHFLNKMNMKVKKNPFVSLLVAVVTTALLVMVIVDSPEEAAQKAFEKNEENALEAAEKSVKGQIVADGFKFIKVKEMNATLTREENINTQQSGIFKVRGTAILKDTKGKKHENIPFQLYVDFYQGEYYAQQMVDIRYGHPLIEQLR